MILAGDIGGTKTNLALFNDDLEVVASRTCFSRQYADLESLVEQFATNLKPQKAAFGIAGPVRDGVCKTTNLPWVVDSHALAQRWKFEEVGLINDLEANAYGLEVLQPADYKVLNEGVPDPLGNQAVIAAGTGLGEAGIYWDGGRRHPFPCEGGHSGFTPHSDLEVELCRYLLTRFGFNDCELVLSGPGLVHIFEFLRDTKRFQVESWLQEEMAYGDPAAGVSRAGMERISPIATQTLDLFVDIYAAEAANLAFKVMSTAGLFIGGGIAPKILPRLTGDRFLQAFLGRGPLRKVLEDMPIKVILNEKTALLGAAYYARRGNHK